MIILQNNDIPARMSRDIFLRADMESAPTFFSFHKDMQGWPVAALTMTWTHKKREG